MNYEPSPGTSIDTAARESHELAVKTGQSVTFDFNGVTLEAKPSYDPEETRLVMRKALGLPEIDPPLYPLTAKDALAKWDAGETVFTVELGGLGPGYEQAIQILVFELIRDYADKLPADDKATVSAWWRTFGDDTVSRIDEKIGGYSGAMVGAAKNLAYRAMRHGWANTVASVKNDRRIQVGKDFPRL